MDSRIPSGLPPNREAVLRHAFGEEGTREKTGQNDGPVERYMPAWARGRKLPYCAWFGGSCAHAVFGRYPYGPEPKGQHFGGAWDYYEQARLRDELILPNQPWPALGPQPGDFGIVLYDEDGNPLTRDRGHLVILVRVGDEQVNCIEGNWRNQVGFTLRARSQFAGFANFYGRLCGEHSSVSWERGVVDAPYASGGLKSTR